MPNFLYKLDVQYIEKHADGGSIVLQINIDFWFLKLKNVKIEDVSSINNGNKLAGQIAKVLPEEAPNDPKGEVGPHVKDEPEIGH